MPRTRLLTQVLLVNLLLIAVAVVAAGLASTPGDIGDRDAMGIVLAFAVALSVLLNYVLLSHRTEPLERLADEMERANLTQPAAARLSDPSSTVPVEVERLHDSFKRMLSRLEAERRRGAAIALEAQERERARVALDLHDEVNQALTGLILRLEAVRAKAPVELSAELAETAKVAREAMEELLALARRLRPSSLDDLGLVAALGGLCEELDRSTPIRIHFESEGSFETIADEVGLVAYRIAQESLSNAVRHSGADNVRAKLLRVDSGLELRVSDDGSGFSFDDAGSGLGLSGMRERALMIEARLEVESRPKLGTRVRLVV